MTKVMTTLEGKIIFINESKTTTQLSSTKIPENWYPAPGSIIGTALCTGGFKLDINNLTDEIATAAMLTKEGLVAAFNKGYIYAWTFQNGKDFRANLQKANDVAKKGKTAQIVTVMNVKTTKPIFK